MRDRYGGEWAIITEGSDQTTNQLAVELAREGYNLIFIVKKDGPEKRIEASTSKFGVRVEFITAENFLAPGQAIEEGLKDKDISIVVSGLCPILKTPEKE